MNSWYQRSIHTLAVVLCAATLCLRAADAPTPPSAPSPPTAPAAPQAPASPETPPPPDDADDDMADLDLDDDDAVPEGAPKPKLNRLQEIVEIGHRVHIRTNEASPTVVVLFENAQIDGRVGEVVVIGGTATINGRVRDQVVAVLGKVKLNATARVGGDVVSIGAPVEREEGSKVGGQVVSVPFLSGVERLAEIPEALSKIISELVFLGRPLSFKIAWVWFVFGAFMLISMAFAAVFPDATERTVDTIQKRGAGSFLIGMATLPLALFFFVLLAASVIGLLAVPFLIAGILMAAFFGKAAVVGFSGRSILNQFGVKNALLLPSILVGSVLLAVFYVMPFIGLLTWMMATTWGLGAAVIALFSAFRNEAQGSTPLQTAGAVPSSPTPTVGTMAPAASTQGTQTESTLAVVTPGATPADPGFAAATPGASTTSGPAFTTAPQPLLPEALTQVRAGFWRKAGAAAIDLAVVSLLSAATLKPPLGFILWLAYFAAMWTWRGTTIGGLVLGLRVVRVDGRPLDVYTAIVRALGGALGFMICFLGVLWCAWDPERQCWHDKMAGTVVIHTKDIQPLI